MTQAQPRWLGEHPVAFAGPRYPSIDGIKAVAIIAVIWIHSFLNLWQPQTGMLRWVGSLTRFAVPAFFFASGLLYFQPDPASRQLIIRRLQRVTVPYVVASLIAIAGQSLYVGPIGLREIGFEILTGNAVGIYYFIPPFIGAVLLIIPLARFRRLALPLLTVLWVLGLLSELVVIWFTAPFFWNQRNPLRWWGYFVAGWCVAEHIGAVRKVSARTRGRLGVVLLAIALSGSLAAVLTLPPGKSIAWVTIEYVNIYACVLGLFFLTFDCPVAPGVRWLSEATYPIYLYHAFFIGLFQVFLAGRLEQQLAVPLLGQHTLAFAGGLSGALLVVWTGRRLLGRHARLLIG